MEMRDVDGRSRPVCPACGYIFYRNPKPVAGCLIEHEGGIILVRRRADPGRGMWGLPAGFVEWGETAEEAAVRETNEETGLVVQLTRLHGVYSFKDVSGSGVLIFYVASVLGGTLIAGDDAEAVAVFPPGAWPENIAFSTHRQALHEWQNGSR
jgi:8-oxo-dGTP diphosphatase